MPTREGNLAGLPKFEWSTMGTATSSGAKLAVLGDWSRFYIGGRVGMTVELIPHLFATGGNRPSGQRGVFAYWRTGTTVAVANAGR